MTRSEFICAIAKLHPHLKSDQIEKCVQLFFKTIASAMNQNQRVELRNFGIFEVRYRPERSTRNPKTGQTIVSQAKRFPSFKAAKELKLRLNQSFDP